MNSNLTLSNIWKVVWKNVIVIVLLMIIGGAGGYLYAHHKRVTTYEARRSVLIAHRHVGSDANEQFMSDMGMMKTYSKIIESNDVANAAHKNLPKKLRKEYSAKRISSMISARPVDQSTIMNVSVEAENAKDATTLVNCVTESSVNEIKRIVPSSGTIRLFAKAKTADAMAHTSPSTKKYALLGAAVGLLAGMVISFSVTTWKHLI
jgi:capsular polysaccharide biosynthesis protein